MDFKFIFALWLLTTFIINIEGQNDEFITDGSCLAGFNPVADLNLTEMSGRWYMIKHFPMAIIQDHKCVQSTFSLQGYDPDLNTTEGVYYSVKGTSIDDEENLVPDEERLDLQDTNGGNTLADFIMITLTGNVDNPEPTPYFVMDTDYDDYACIYVCRDFFNTELDKQQKIEFPIIYLREPVTSSPSIDTCQNLFSSLGLSIISFIPVDHPADCIYSKQQVAEEEKQFPTELPDDFDSVDIVEGNLVARTSSAQFVVPLEGDFKTGFKNDVYTVVVTHKPVNLDASGTVVSTADQPVSKNVKFMDLANLARSMSQRLADKLVHHISQAVLQMDQQVPAQLANWLIQVTVELSPSNLSTMTDILIYKTDLSHGRLNDELNDLGNEAQLVFDLARSQVEQSQCFQLAQNYGMSPRITLILSCLKTLIRDPSSDCLDQVAPMYPEWLIWQHLRGYRLAQEAVFSEKDAPFIEFDTKADQSPSFSPTETDWMLLRDSVFSATWESRGRKSEQRKAVDMACQLMVNQMEIAFHASAVKTATYLQARIQEKRPIQVKKTEQRQQETVEYVIQQIPLKDLQSGLFKTRIGDCHPQFGGHLKSFQLESINVEVPGMPNTIIEATSTNAFVTAFQEQKQVLHAGVPTTLICSEAKCVLDKGTLPQTAHALWRFKLASMPSNWPPSLRVVDLKVTFYGSVNATLEKVNKVLPDPIFLDKRSMPQEDYCNAKPTDKQKEDTLQWVTDKYGHYSQILLNTDILVGMGLSEMNQLFKILYEKGEGVVTHFSSGWSSNFGNQGCYEIPGVISLKIEKYSRLNATLRNPQFFFLQNNPGYLRLTWEFVNGSVFETKTVFRAGDCTDSIHLNMTTQYESAPVNASSIEAVVPLNILYGSVSDGEDGGSVIMNMVESAFMPGNLTYECEKCEDEHFDAIKQDFIEFFSSIQLSTINYDSGITPDITKPQQFLFSTICSNCEGVPGDHGYLFMSIKTFSPNSAFAGTPMDGTCCGFDQATPEWYNSIIFLASHILFRDVIEPAWEADGKYDYLTDTWVDYKTTLKLILSKTGITASLPEGQGDINIQTNDFQLTAEIDRLRVVMDYDHPIDIRVNGGSCHFSWWDIFTLGISYWIRCSIVAHQHVWKNGKLIIGADQTSGIDFKPECFSFQTPAIEVDPTVDIQLSGGDGHDRDAADRTENNIRNVLGPILHLRATASPDVSLFAAANLLFPSARVMTLDNLFIPGDVIMLGNICTDYEEIDPGNLPDYCSQ